MNYWLLKSEPTTYCIDDLIKAPKKTTHWDGVRNYQARNMLRGEMKVGDFAFFYHSNCPTPGITGIVEVVKAGYPDFTAFDPEDHHYDPQSDPDKPRWFMVDVKFVKKFKTTLSLDVLRSNPALKNMMILRKGNRLSVTPLTKKEWEVILRLDK